MNADLDYIKLIQLEARIKGKKLVHSNKKESFLRTEEKKRINFLETENGKRKKESFLNVFPTKIISFENFQNNLNVSNCYDDTRAHKPDLFNLKEYSAQDNSNSHHKNEDGNNSLMSWLSDSKTMKNEEENTLKLKIAQIEFQLHLKLQKERQRKSELYLRLEEEKRKSENISNLYKKIRFGDYFMKTNGKSLKLAWKDGEEIESARTNLKKMLESKNQLQISLKSLKSYKIKKNHEDYERRERVFSQIRYLNKELKANVQILTSLEQAKSEFQIRLNLLHSEENSSLYQKWPLLNNRYQVLSLHGKGGFSEIYKAVDLETDSLKILKLHKIKEDWSQQRKEYYYNQSIKEGKVLKSLNHENIIKFEDFLVIDQNNFATIMEFCDGVDLGAYIQAKKCLPEFEVKDIMKQIIFAIKHIHEKNIIHHDLKLQNIIYNAGLIKIIDFGLSKLSTSIEDQNYQFGTYWYLPPECFLNEKSTLKIDIWSIGVICFELLFGYKPFAHNVEQEKILRDKLIVIEGKKISFPEKTNVSDDAKGFIKRCLEYDYRNRWSVWDAEGSLFLA